MNVQSIQTFGETRTLESNFGLKSKTVISLKVLSRVWIVVADFRVTDIKKHTYILELKMLVFIILKSDIP